MANLYGKRNLKLKIARNMPPLYHKRPGEEYDVQKSEAVQWLLNQPEIQEFVWTQFKQSKDIAFDSLTGKWQGVDYAMTCPHGDEWNDCPDCRH